MQRLELYELFRDDPGTVRETLNARGFCRTSRTVTVRQKSSAKV